MTLNGLPLTDPGSGGSLTAAVTWVGSLLTGTVATAIATIAIAGIGFLMLQGRLPLRRGATIVVGCFIIFGAGTISRGLMMLSTELTGNSRAGSALNTIPPTPIRPPAQPEVYDPYAGASVPVR
jgi:type IV secretory pathway VirB2 component (pilin)